jgi:hypothetical protein
MPGCGWDRKRHYRLNRMLEFVLSASRYFTLLGVPNQNPFDLASHDIPNPDGAIVAPRNQRSPSGSQCTNRVVVSAKQELMIRILFDVLLQKL